MGKGNRRNIPCPCNTINPKSGKLVKRKNCICKNLYDINPYTFLEKGYIEDMV